MTQPDEIEYRPPDFVSCLQLKAARTLLDWTQADLARAAGVTLSRIGNLETAKSSRGLENVIDALENAGITFISDRKHARTGVVFASEKSQAH